MLALLLSKLYWCIQYRQCNSFIRPTVQIYSCTYELIHLKSYFGDSHSTRSDVNIYPESSFKHWSRHTQLSGCYVTLTTRSKLTITEGSWFVFFRSVHILVYSLCNYVYIYGQGQITLTSTDTHILTLCSRHTAPLYH